MTPVTPLRARWLVAVEELAGVTTNPGGVARQYAEILPRLADLGVDVDVLVVSPRETVAPDGLGYPVRVLPPPAWARGALWMLWGAWRVRRAAVKGGYDAVLAPEWVGLAAYVGAGTPVATNLVTGARLLDEIGGTAGRRPLTRVSRRVQYALEARQIRRSAGVVAISTAIRDWYVGAGYRLGAQVEVIPNCIDVEHVSRASTCAPLPEGWPGAVRTILFAGRLERRKGIDDVVEAFRSIAADDPDVRLVLAGAFGDPAVELDAGGLRAALGPVAERTDVLGPVAADSLYRAMAVADVVVCPSRWEAFGLVALEAKAAGAQLVVTRGSGFDDFCKDGVDCRMVDPASPRELADVCRELLGAADRGQALRDAAAASARVFGPDHVVPRYVEAVGHF
jgi:glycogen synthase